MDGSILTPVLALIAWTLVILLWMYATRIPAITAADIDPGKIKQKQDLDGLPMSVKQIADNHNHLHEQPILFYALAFYSHLSDLADPINLALAWGYVAIRVVHSLIQTTFNYVPVRFFVFVAGSVVLIAWTVRLALDLFGV